MNRLCLLLLWVASCAGVEEGGPLSKAARVQGQIEGAGGDGWLFLYPPGQGFPGAPAVPKYLSAASAARRLSGDDSYVFAQVAPNPYRLWAFVDVDGNFDPNVDVLAQPGAGDRVSQGHELNLQPGKTHFEPVQADLLVATEPPAFRLEGVAGEVVLDAQPSSTTVLTLVADDVGKRLDGKKIGFPIGLVDADHDGRPDDANNDSVPDLSLQVVLRFVPRPGQVMAGATVVVPVILNPAPFLTALNGSVTAVVVVDRIQGYVLPQAQQLVSSPGKPDQITPLGAPLPGEYELVALAAGGQYWRIPNGLRGVLPEQGVRFHFDRVAP
ncbi:MAG: hypothetical protein H6Q89_3030 [Myxococcaceae bacterium]|nr:hypothetical protein [Myxococcaceae bacterium]